MSAWVTEVTYELDQVGLSEHYVQTNTRIQNGEKEHVRFHKDGTFHVTTPKLEEDDTEPISSLFPTERHISLLEVLSTVNRLSGFIDTFEPWHRKYARSKPPNKTFFAGIIGIGCFIGTRKMEKISAAINGAELETTVNTYFTLENIDAANDRVLKLMSELELPEIYRNQPGVLHTSSDGQRHEVSVDSLNAYYSYKYFGKDQGATVRMVRRCFQLCRQGSPLRNRRTDAQRGREKRHPLDGHRRILGSSVRRDASARILIRSTANDRNFNAPSPTRVGA